MKYIDRMDEKDIKEFIENHTHFRFVRCEKISDSWIVKFRKPIQEGSAYIYEAILCDFNAQGLSVGYNKLWNLFLYEKFGERYINDYQETLIKLSRDKFREKQDKTIKEFTDENIEIIKNVSQLKKNC